MLYHPTIEKLLGLRLNIMAKALQEQLQSNDVATLSFEERLGLLADREMSARDTRQLNARLKQAHLRHNACFEDLDKRPARGFDRTLLEHLENCQWIAKHRNGLITGLTGVGKSWLACALGHKACLQGYHAQYHRVSKLLGKLTVGHGDGSYDKQMRVLSRMDLLILDDFGLGDLSKQQLYDLLEILEERYDRRSTLVTSQLPVQQWHGYLNEPALADAILDRLIHNAYTIELKGESMRKQRA